MFNTAVVLYVVALVV